MKSQKRTWYVFSLCIVVVIVSLGWLSWKFLKLERLELESHREAEYQESLRLALWRIDSTLTSIIAIESARSAESYRTPKGEDQPQEEFTCNQPFCNMHFELSQDPKKSKIHLAASDFDSAEKKIDRSLSNLNALLEWKEQFREKLGTHAVRVLCQETDSTTYSQEPDQHTVTEPQQLQKSQKEYAARWENYGKAQSNSPFKTETLMVGSIVPFWVAHSSNKNQINLNIAAETKDINPKELFLVREIRKNDEVAYQGMWVDWSTLRISLLESIHEFFPSAALIPSDDIGREPTDRVLASIPAVLSPGPLAPIEIPVFSNQRLFLVGSWILVLLATGFTAYVLHASMELSERRARFVSAVTHELRTPLTTFQLYSQMLADGMVKEEKDQREYLGTLKIESEKLSKIVENVLLYARVEGGKSAPIKEQVSVASLLSQIRERLDRRAKEAGMELLIENRTPENCTLELDPQSVEQILFNLVDNSCKYASSATDRRLHLEISQKNQNVEFLYSDHGPGIPPTEAKKVFLPFERGAAQEAAATRGIGMGLTLSRSLARQLGGELTLINTNKQGAFFLLQLPLSSS